MSPKEVVSRGGISSSFKTILRDGFECELAGVFSCGLKSRLSLGSIDVEVEADFFFQVTQSARKRRHLIETN